MPFSPEIVAAVRRHMNEDHLDDALIICQGLGGTRTATAASMTDMDEHGIDFTAVVDGAEVSVRLPWTQELTERPQIRVEVTDMYHRACAALGIEPRPPEGEH